MPSSLTWETSVENMGLPCFVENLLKEKHPNPVVENLPLSLVKGFVLSPWWDTVAPSLPQNLAKKKDK